MSVLSWQAKIGVLASGLAFQLFAADAGVASIIPVPAHLTERAGDFQLRPDSCITADAELLPTAELLAGRLRSGTGFVIPIQTNREPESGDIRLTTAGADTNLGPEGYELRVTPHAVLIRAVTSAGAFYGGQSLLQLLPPEIFRRPAAAKTAWMVPGVDISDSPRFPWRGFMLDVSRHFFTKAEVEQVLDLMALYKLNTFHWHLVDDQGWRLQIRKYPELTGIGAWRGSIGFDLDPKASTAYDANGRYGGFYTQDDIREVVAYAAARHITIVPEIEMPGHSSAALAAFPGLACPGVTVSRPDKAGVFNGIYCAGNDETFVFLDNVVAEAAELFPGKYIHIGGDEVAKGNWKQCPLCQARLRNEHLRDERALQAYFIRRVEQIVTAHGKTLIGWSEIREGGLASSAALMDWIGGGAESAASGHDVVMTPKKFCYFDHAPSLTRTNLPKGLSMAVPLDRVYEFEPIPDNLAPPFRAHVLGGQANLWTEYVPNLGRAEFMMFPRLCALAEVDWSPKASRDWNGFQARVGINERRLTALGVNFCPAN